jgi:putative transposase
MILTYKIKHGRDFSSELFKAIQIAEFVIRTRTRTSKDVKQFGLKSVIANQILRKYGKNKRIRKVRNIKLVIPNQGIKLNTKFRTIEITSLKLILEYKFPQNFSKINQIEIDNQFAYVSVSIDEKTRNYTNTIGVDLNTRDTLEAKVDNKNGHLIYTKK